MAARTTARHPRARRPAPRKRRRSRKSLHPYRWAMFLPAPVAGPLGWQQLHDPLGTAGWALFLVLSLLLVPPLMLTLFTAPGTLLHAAVPRPWRKWSRHHDWRKLFLKPKRHPGPPQALLRRTITAADRGKCVACGATAAQVRAWAVARQLATGARSLTMSSLQYDHCFPWSLGGLINFWNLFLLCPRCNHVKSNYWKYRESGNVVYRGFADASDVGVAAAILAAEMHIRHSPWLMLARCWRAAWAM